MLVAAHLSRGVFVSHSRADDAFCGPFCARLAHTLGLDDPDLLYWDQSTFIDANEPGFAEICFERNLHELARRNIFILLLTRPAATDAQVRIEVAEALRLSREQPERTIITALVDACEPSLLARGLEMHPLVRRLNRDDVPAFADLSALVRDALQAHLGQTHFAMVDGEQTVEQAPRAFSPREGAGAQTKHQLESNPYRAERWRALGVASGALGQHDKAQRALRRARALAPLSDVDARLNLLAEQLPFWRSRILDHDLSRLSAAGSTSRDALATRLDLALEMARLDEALSLVRQLTTVDDPAAGAWFLRARLARVVAGDTSEVREAISRARRLADQSPGVVGACNALLQPPVWPGGLPARLAELGLIHRIVNGFEVIVPPTCSIPAGAFLMGSDPAQDPEAFIGEQPQHEECVSAYAISRFPTTVAEYACFVRAGHRAPLDWDLQLTLPDLPVTRVAWYDAVQYAAWLSRTLGETWRLPSEPEWEKAARWDADLGRARVYPWGDIFEVTRCNTSASGLDVPTPIGVYAAGTSPWGLHDMAGNVWEWIDQTFRPYSGRAPTSAAPTAVVNRVLRGGSARHRPRLARCACRAQNPPHVFASVIGFRLVRAGLQEKDETQ